VSAAPWVAGADGCRAGWVVVLWSPDGSRAPQVQVVPTFAAILELPEYPQVLAIDMPIGLPEITGIGGRAPDVAARRVLGDRQSSIFAVPSRRAVMAPDYRAACDAALATSEPPRKVSKQAWNLFPRIRELDALMTPELQERVYECHPEVAFWAMNGEQPLDQPKKVKSRPHPPGLDLRRGLLVKAGFPAAALSWTPSRRSDAGPDDVLDAFACAWTAARILRGEAHTFPPDPPLDARGLRQEIKA
jgi:predicted RNase H-like nuclease